MDYPTAFHLISDISKKTGISCILIGGFAVNFYKVSRQTADVDFLITKDDFEKILPLLEKEGYKQEYSQEVFARLKNTESSLMDIDFMFVDKETIDKIINDAKETNIAGQKFIVPSLNNLIALKLHSIKYNPKLRESTDLPDIINLIRINHLDVQTESFHQLCLKYGSEEIYNKILSSA
ncbi:MAG: nucleotidyl transferase AbiEii/AbiGii toxin family protein [Candidatus Omnitrophota bacterium]